MDEGIISGDQIPNLYGASTFWLGLNDRCTWTIDDSSGRQPFLVNGVDAPRNITRIVWPVHSIVVNCGREPRADPVHVGSSTTGSKAYMLSVPDCEYTSFAQNMPMTFKASTSSNVCYVLEAGNYTDLSFMGGAVNQTKLYMWYGTGSFSLTDLDTAHPCFLFLNGDSVYDSDGSIHDIDLIVPPILSLDIIAEPNGGNSSCYRPNNGG